MSEHGHEDLDLVIAAQQGDGDAFGQLYDRWFDRVHDVARRVVRDPGIAAEITQDVFLVTWQQLATLRQPESFGGWLLRATRNRSLDRLERERRSVALGDEETVMEIDRQAPVLGRGEVPADVFDRNEQEEMVWAAAAALGDRDVSILHLHLRHGLDGADLAQELGVSANAANQAMFRLRDRLGGSIRAWVLWRHGQPACEQLDALLSTTGVDRFGRDAVRTINAHADDCARCGRHRAVLVAPESLFAAVPLLTPPPGLKDRVAGALAAEGVPISTSFEARRGTAGRSAMRRRRPLLMAAAAGLLLLAAGVSLAWVLGGGGDDAETAATASSDGATTSAPGETTTTTTTASSTTSELPDSSTATPSTTTTVPVTPPTSGPAGGTSPAAPPPPSPTIAPPPPTSSGPPPTTQPPPAPAITSFTGQHQPVPGECASPSEHIELAWTTDDADHVTISGPGAPAGQLPADGSAIACHPVAADYTLTAVGPGGSRTRTITVPPL